VVGDLPANTIAPELDDVNAAAALKAYSKETGYLGDPLAANAIDVKTLGIYLSYLIAVGFLLAPAENGECKLPRIDESRLQALVAGRLGGRSARP